VILEEGAARKAIACAVDAIAEAAGERGAEQRATTHREDLYLHARSSRPRPESVHTQPETEPDIRA
jgi:hypothetical protein